MATPVRISLSIHLSIGACHTTQTANPLPPNNALTPHDTQTQCNSTQLRLMIIIHLNLPIKHRLRILERLPPDVFWYTRPWS